MKIGIITFHRAQNYGAVLQCYALYSYIKNLGADVEVIDYYPTVFREEYSQFPKSAFKKAPIKGKLRIIYNYIKNLKLSNKRTRIFGDFINRNINLSEKQYDENNFQVSGYDVIVWGSDQVWNPKLTGGKDRVFAGDFYKGDTRFVSFAASTMLDSDQSMKNETIDYYKGIITRFDYISTREERFAEYLNRLVSPKAIHVLDPVFLLSKEQWESVTEKPTEDKYLLVYVVPSNMQISNFARTIAEKKGLNLIEISSHGNKIVNNTKGSIVSPLQFLGYFLNASFIITSSFHGTAFSIRFNKQFYTILKGNSYDGRAYNLLKELCLENRAIRIDNDDIPSESIDYGIAEKLLIAAETKAKKYIESSIS